MPGNTDSSLAGPRPLTLAVLTPNLVPMGGIASSSDISPPWQCRGFLSAIHAIKIEEPHIQVIARRSHDKPSFQGADLHPHHISKITFEFRVNPWCSAGLGIVVQAGIHIIGNALQPVLPYPGGSFSQPFGAIVSYQEILVP